MIRSIWKPVSNYLEKNNKDLFFSHGLRKAIILNQHIGTKIVIHNGSSRSQMVEIKKPMVGFKFGQLVLTKAKVIHQIKKKKKK